MQGTINVEAFMDYSQRQRRMLEWWFLKEYWRAKKEGKEALVLDLYGQPLQRALEKYRQRYDPR